MSRKAPHCRKCNTPMKGHLRGRCRPMSWHNHSTNTSHGGKYSWEKTSVLKKTLAVDGVETELAVSKNSVIAENKIIIDTGNTVEAEEWKPLANKTWWVYYRKWQGNSLTVPFPTRMGMSSEQLGDIMQNYSKYVAFYR